MSFYSINWTESSSGIGVGGAIYAASYMMQTFPTRVVINTSENIILYDSDVSLWGTDNVKVLQGLRKNDEQNPQKVLEEGSEIC